MSKPKKFSDIWDQKMKKAKPQRRGGPLTHNPRPQRNPPFAASPCWADRPLAHKMGIQVVLGLLVASGGMCPKCGFGTRVTSNNWSRCKKCGERVKRVKMSDIKIVQGPPNAGYRVKP